MTVVTGFPNYPYGRIYPGYRLRPIHHETVDGVRIVRLPLYPSHDRSTLRRSLNFLSFFFAAFIYLLLRRSKFDLAYVYHPPITVGLAASFARIPFVLDVQDLWPDTVVATKMRWRLEAEPEPSVAAAGSFIRGRRRSAPNRTA